MRKESQARLSRKEAWASEHGLKLSQGDVCLRRLLGKHCLEYKSSAFQRCPLHMLKRADHVTVWVTGGRAVLYLSQPYRFFEEDRDELESLAAEYGLAWTIDPAAAWHNPPSVTGVVVWNPEYYAYEVSHLTGGSEKVA